MIYICCIFILEKFKIFHSLIFFLYNYYQYRISILRKIDSDKFKLNKHKMSNTIYIELDSTFRDRNQFPLPSFFNIPISMYGNGDRFNSKDPISDMAPLISFTGNFNLAGGATLNALINAFTAIGATSSSQELVLSAVAGQMVQTENYYVGAIFQNGTTNERRRVRTFRYLNTSGGVDRGIFTFYSPYTTVTAGNTMTALNPSDNNLPNAHIFIPFDDIFNQNVYVNLVLIDETIGEARSITSYDSLTAIATLDGVFGPGWANTDSYTIRVKAPYELGTLTASTINTFTLPVAFSNVNDFYTGSFIRITSGPASGDMRRIVNYSDATVPSTVGTVFPPFSAVPGLATFEILQFTKDNYNPLAFIGSLTSSQENVAYEIELLNLILPNKDLNVDLGNRIVFHPYVICEFSNVSSNPKNVIYSNNPNTVSAMFRVPITDIPSPLVSSYIKLDGDGMVQTVKFKPNDTLLFKVKMLNGQLFSTVDQEFFSPLPPNPAIQISACFGIKRIMP